MAGRAEREEPVGLSPYERAACGVEKDHNSICTFRRTNGALLEIDFGQVLAMAAQMRVLKVAQVTLAIDGAKILANAGKHSAVSHGHASEQIKRLEKRVAELLAKAEAADSAPLEDGLALPEEIARRQERLEQLRAANKVIRARAKERYERERAEFQPKKQERAERAERAEQTGKKPRKRAPKPPRGRPPGQGSV